MAKGNIFVGTASGKIGNLVLSRNAMAQNYTDKQIIRAYTAETGRKKGVTYSDSVYHQNAHFKASSQFFELVKSISGHGFQSAKKTVAANRLAFKSANDVKAAPAYYAICGAGDDSRFVLAPWILTKGSMLVPPYKYGEKGGVQGQTKVYRTGLYLGTGILDPDTDTPVSRISSSLLAMNRNMPYLSEGCQISIVTFGAAQSDPYMNLVFDKYEFTINSQYQEEASAAPWDLFSHDVVTERLNLSVNATTNEIEIANTSILGMAVIISKFQDGNKKKLMVTTSKIVLREDVALEAAKAAAAPYVADLSELDGMTEEQAYQIVIDTWKPGSGYSDSGSSTPSYDPDEPFLDPNL